MLCTFWIVQEHEKAKVEIGGDVMCKFGISEDIEKAQNTFRGNHVLFMYKEHQETQSRHQGSHDTPFFYELRI